LAENFTTLAEKKQGLSHDAHIHIFFIFKIVVAFTSDKEYIISRRQGQALPNPFGGFCYA